MRRLAPFLTALFVALFVGALLAPAASADGFLIPTRPDRRVRGDWAVTYHHVEVRVAGQKAHVRVDQEFTNLASAVRRGRIRGRAAPRPPCTRGLYLPVRRRE
jgi:hypothetical protein